jgi:ketopantoate hydroxymethyltransferase
MTSKAVIRNPAREAAMTTDCFEAQHIELRAGRETAAPIAELGAAIITVAGFILLLPAAAWLMGLLAG